MKTVDNLDVLYDGKKVGTLAKYDNYLTAFEYSKDWLENGFSISPFSLPLEPGVKISSITPFEGMFGIFEDSLPDGWGRLLVDRMLLKEGINPATTDKLTRLSIVGSSGMGALEYRPAFKNERDKLESKDYDRLAAECKKVLQSKKTNELDLLFTLGGSSGGARPKVMLEADGEEWIVKFPASGDSDSIGKMEYDYNLCARECGIDIPEIRLFPSKKCAGYFGSKRFDRENTDKGIKKLHMASASALLEVTHRIPALDYINLMGLTWQLTKRSEEVLKMFSLMCFNVYAHNRDDHSNNFSFIYKGDHWTLSPAYDLTYSDSIGGEHATTIAGEGKNPTINNILQVAKKAGIKESVARQTAERIRDTVNTMLGKYMK